LQHIRTGQAPFEVFDSVLNEEALLAWEYGYSTLRRSNWLSGRRSLVILPTAHRWRSISLSRLAKPNGTVIAA
jgi:hypothetical protein